MQKMIIIVFLVIQFTIISSISSFLVNRGFMVNTAFMQYNLFIYSNGQKSIY